MTEPVGGPNDRLPATDPLELLLSFIPEFTEALVAQLQADNERWAETEGADTWLTKREIVGQEARIMGRYIAYWHAYVNDGTPVPWLKITGLALIAFIREQHPEMWNNR